MTEKTMLRNLKSFNLPELEEKVLSFWKEKGIFEKTLKPSRPGSNGKTFNFWEGPPTANGRPGLHHVLARSFKDVVLRYKTMQGFTVPRKAGWDTHGLPVELQVEKQLGLASKKDIEKYGIAAFNKACRESVWQYKSEWEKLTERMGFWLDLKHPYVTYENSYVEVLWHIIAQFFSKKLLYQGHKVVPWCPRCGTALSSHELAQGYKTVKDQSVFTKFKVTRSVIPAKAGIQKNGSRIKSGMTDRNGLTDADLKNAYVLSWTTTPWTLPGNVALAVGKNISYALVRIDGNKEVFILAEDLIEKVFAGQTVEKIRMVKGSELIGLEYEPLFHVPALKTDASYKIYDADFVTTEDGTGVVHTAVMYGEDDYELGKKVGLPQKHTVDEQGKFVKEVSKLAGMFVKGKETEKKIFEILEKQGNLLKVAEYEHEYPFCWRCSTPLLYYARTSWFVKMSSLKKQMLAANEQINWVPAHVKQGRFGEWLKDVKDWNFSRERYWGTPLPLWKCDSCEHTETLGSFAEISKRADRGNSYLVMRHGQATSNVDGWLAGGVEPKSGKFLSKLTKRGIEDTEKAAQKLKSPKGGEKIDIIYSSPYHRALETAKIVSKITGAKVLTDKRLVDTDFGVFNRRNVTEYWASFKEKIDAIRVSVEKGESLNDVRRRVYAFLREVDAKYTGKKILIVTHGDPARMLAGALEHLSDEEVLKKKEKIYLHWSEAKKISYDHLPTDDLGHVDPHRPYIDEVIFPCKKCGKKMKRVPEVADVWFDSGAMPLASQTHAESRQKSVSSQHWSALQGYPADYICEAMDQTRGWFYTLLAVATALGMPLPPYKNVISLGLIHDKQGQKMSKSRGNIVDPWALMQKYGIDAVRWYFYTLNDPGESKNFDELDVQKALRRFHMVAYNSFSFLSLYGKKSISLASAPASVHILDKWILGRLAVTSAAVAGGMDAYNIMKASAALELFTDDLSRWYIRRSRRRLQKPESQKDWEFASATLGYALLEYAKLIAPFTPFFADGLFQSLKKEYKGIPEESVHLTRFPSSHPERSRVVKRSSTTLRSRRADTSLDSLMQWVRELASAALAKRAELQIKVRQPLAKLSVKKLPKGSEPVLDILKDELNVKEIVEDKKLGNEFELDTVITPELKAEGLLREFVRTVQDLRQDGGLMPKDKIELWLEGSEQIQLLVRGHEKMLLREVGAKKISIGKSEKTDAEIETKVDEYKSWIGIKKVKG